MKKNINNSYTVIINNKKGSLHLHFMCDRFFISHVKSKWCRINAPVARQSKRRATMVKRDKKRGVVLKRSHSSSTPSSDDATPTLRSGKILKTGYISGFFVKS